MALQHAGGAGPSARAHLLRVEVLGPCAHDAGGLKAFIASGGGQRVVGDAAVIPVLRVGQRRGEGDAAAPVEKGHLS